MDPDLARIRREAYLSHKRRHDEAKPASSSVEVIDVDNDSLEPKKAAAANASWACQHCTFVNKSNKKSCEMCTHVNLERTALDNSDDEVVFVPNPNAKHAIRKSDSKRAKTSHHSCYLNSNILYDPHPKSTESGGWIWSQDRSQNEQIAADVEGMTAQFQTLVANNTKITRDQVLNLAKAHKVTCGKWLLYQKSEYIAETWGKIRDAMYEGKLGDVAKVAKDSNNGTFVVCVYCKDFGDRNDVLRVRKALYETAQIKAKIFFKPDCFTYLNIYSGNPFKIRPTIYSCGVVDGAEMTLTDVK